MSSTVRVAQTDTDIMRGFDVMRQLRPHLLAPDFLARKYPVTRKTPVSNSLAGVRRGDAFAAQCPAERSDVDAQFEAYFVLGGALS